MTYTIERLDDMPVALGVWHQDFDFMRDSRAYSADMRTLLDQQESPVFYVLDMSAYKTMSLEELIDASNLAARGKNANFHHPMVRQILLISTDKGVEISVQGLRTEAFGNADTLVFPTREDALAYVAQQLS
ncbi:MAG: hypothetical protein CUN55_00415 [Phototrophicales bacterium]|nr:MAG: hypothetical protein CUN55_00415 [Phototrophicales bacterium]